MSQDDDLYVYGNMSFDGRQNWALSGSELDLQSILAEGRFARVHKADVRRAGSGPQTVAAKMLLRKYLTPLGALGPTFIISIGFPHHIVAMFDFPLDSRSFAPVGCTLYRYKV